MATMIADCSCDYHASGWPFPWEVTESWVDDSTLERLCEFESCQVYLAAQKDLWARFPEIRKCSNGSMWDVFARAVASVIVVIGFGIAVGICVRAWCQQRRGGGAPPPPDTSSTQMEPVPSASGLSSSS